MPTTKIPNRIGVWWTGLGSCLAAVLYNRALQFAFFCWDTQIASKGGYCTVHHPNCCSVRTCPFLCIHICTEFFAPGQNISPSKIADFAQTAVSQYPISSAIASWPLLHAIGPCEEHDRNHPSVLHARNHPNATVAYNWLVQPKRRAPGFGPAQLFSSSYLMQV